MIITFQLNSYLLMIVMWNYGFYTADTHFYTKQKNIIVFVAYLAISLDASDT